MLETPFVPAPPAGSLAAVSFPGIPRPLQSAVGKLLQLEAINRFYTRALETQAGNGFERILGGLQLDVRVSGEELRRIPAHGATVLVANHPFGMLEGIVLGALLSRIRPDIKIVANRMLGGLTELADSFLFVDPFGGAGARRANLPGVRKCLEHLDREGLLVLFPAGEVSHLDLRSREVRDPEWSTSAARLIARCSAQAVPVYFGGGNSLPFHLLGAMHPLLRTLRLPHELFRMRGHQVTVRVGRPIPAAALAGQDEQTVTRTLRERTYVLGTGAKAPKWRSPIAMPQARVAAGAEPGVIERELAGLGAEAVLSSTGDYEVLLLEGGRSPVLLRELGRLRELTFRGVGEGTGKSTDTDRFDRHYHHLLLRHRGTGRIAGGYRVASTLDVLPAQGTKGLYTSTLFRFDERFFERLGPALELGRSWIHPEFQRGFAPLLTLWKGIGAYVCRRPEHRYLFGPLSISRQYSDATRRLMARTLSERHSLPELTGLVTPRKRFAVEQPGDPAGALVALNMEDLSSLVMDSEGTDIPVLVRQYLKMGGRVAGFNLDRKFSGVVDALVIVDLCKAPRASLERYFGKAGSAAFLGRG